jgi:hypothetical protein
MKNAMSYYLFFAIKELMPDWRREKCPLSQSELRRRSPFVGTAWWRITKPLEPVKPEKPYHDFKFQNLKTAKIRRSSIGKCFSILSAGFTDLSSCCGTMKNDEKRKSGQQK